MDEIKDKCKEGIKGNDRRLNELINYIVTCCYKGGMLPDEILPVFEEATKFCDPLMLDNKIKDKFRVCVNECVHADERSSLSQEVYDFVLTTSGNFLTTDVYNGLHLTTRKDKKNATMALLRLIKNNVIERVGNKNGCFRLIQNDVEIIDWKKDSGEELDLALPMSLDRLVKIYPRNLIVVAGMSNTGKTAFMLNFVGLNLDKFGGKMKYFSSEMGECELKTRLRKFGLPDDVWNGCIFYERSKNFADVIDPNAINIIDYYEISDDFSNIGEGFKRIYDKLEGGIAVIAIQKTEDKRSGRGGSFSEEKPRLYLTLDEDKEDRSVILATILKAKNWKTDINPSKRWKRIRINDGYKIEELTTWQSPRSMYD
jgi:hypothetical protein